MGMSNLTPDLRKIVLALQDRAAQEGCPRTEADVSNAIADCILAHKPIPADLQDQYVKLLANQNGQDRYGK
jgi:hypothetical protein